tara:strand:+ start:13482 stop:13811 length:330 start_codon:yes stop_codon:yes gene_type:complete
MPYCSLAIQIEAPKKAIDILSAFACEQFNARNAYQLDERQFVIDGGLNDLRAIQQDDVITYGFFCRYVKDLHRTEVKIQIFAKNQIFECNLVDLDSVKKIKGGVDNDNE